MFVIIIIRIFELSINKLKMSFYNYTTQQLQGGGKYSVKAKIGNWYEDKILNEMR
jgi:hypothetical protein